MNSFLRNSLGAILAITALVFTAGQGLAAEHTIRMESYGFFQFRFSPNYLEIEVGDTVTWLNDDYTQFGYGGYDAAIFEDGEIVGYTYVLEPGESASLIFPYASTFTFMDTEYGEYGMTGTIVVREPQGTALPPTFINPEWLPQGGFSCTISNLVIGTTNVVFAAESPAAEASSWSIVKSNIVSATEEIFVDSNTVQRRFYRAVRP